jgi:PAS domain S-box-containing protein
VTFFTIFRINAAMAKLEDYHWLFRKAPAMASLIDGEGRFLDVNDALLGRLEFTRGEMIGRRPAEFVTEGSARRIEQEFVPTLRRTGKLENKPIAFRTRSGEIVECITNSLVEHDPDGFFVRTVAIYTEATDEARANFKYRNLYRATPAMLHTVDANGCIVTVTDHWLQKMGYSRDEVVGRSILDFYSNAFRKKFAGGRLLDVIEGGEFDNEEREMVTKDGIVLELLVSAISKRDAAGNVERMLVASKDVTKRNRAERALRKTLAENARLREELERERDYLREEVNVAMNFGRIVGKSPALKYMMAQVEAVSDTPASVLILGESGVGKELVARAIHAKSPRAEGPLVKVNCASIPKDLFESEFFGHVKGAYTGAHRDRVGRFQLADGGTIFLDEVGEIPVELQGKLLHVLQESEFERVGDDITKSVDVRVIAATNRDLEQLVMAGKFREDLFYRLSVFPIEVPPLRKRGDDVLQLARHFLEATCNDFGRAPMRLTRIQADEIRNYDWPGNVRELKNVIERAVILSQGDVLRLDLSLPGTGIESVAGSANDAGAATQMILDENDMKDLQKKNLMAALTQTNWRVSGKGGAAELLGVRPTTLNDRIKSFGLRKPQRS